MNIAIDINEYNQENVFFNKPIKNTVIDNSNFIRTVFSNKSVSLNGIYLKIKLDICSIERYYNKYKCNYDIEINKKLLDTIEFVEDSIINRINIQNKVPIYKIKEQIGLGNIKLFTDNIDNLYRGYFILKISGIWENVKEYGITFKFIDIV